MLARKKRTSIFLVAFGLLPLGIALANLQGSAKPTREQEEFFEAKIRPTLAANCFSCHGKDSQSAGLRLDTPEGIAKVIVAGDPKRSRLLQVLSYSGSTKMPPSGKLSESKIKDFETWIATGAPWPTATSAGAGDLWSLKQVRNPAVPPVKRREWCRNEIDSFVLARLEQKSLSPAGAADRRTLIRRLTFDLTGLPPTPGEVSAFLADPSRQAYDRVVDRLLASRHYGERQARLWMDVARYADTKGYVFEEDRVYHNAYTYRDWLINAFNRDLPYDRFITMQLAGDRLLDFEGDRSDLAALGFLTVGRRFLNNTPDIIDDRIDVTMRGLQAFTVSCARCHDHKFDPIPTQDYYSLYGIFNSSEEQTIPISPKEIRDPWEANNLKVASVETAVNSLILSQVQVLRKNIESQPAEIKEALQSLREGQMPDDQKLAKLLKGFEKGAPEKLTAMRQELGELRKAAPRSPEFGMALVDRKNPGDVKVFRRGNPGSPGELAPRRFLMALSLGRDREPWTQGSGRLELAKSIASKQNPLTARVFVNRAWMHHFGAGLVRTPSDFGHQGERPTHPELLDYLAAKFMLDGWSMKKLHKLIVSSATYRQSSMAEPEYVRIDPENRLIGHMNRRRLDLEQMRDSLFAVAGLLEKDKIGGPSVDLWARPYIPRRALYGFIERQNLPGIFRTFDFASPDSTSAKRYYTTVPQQALFFMNSPFVVEQAQALANRFQARSDGGKIEALYKAIYQRAPTKAEVQSGREYLAGTAVKGKTSRLALYAQALLMANEFLFVD